jgi:hypothetical protein
MVSSVEWRDASLVVSLIMNIASVGLSGACVYLRHEYPIGSLIMAFVSGMMIVVSSQYSIGIEQNETEAEQKLQDS